MDLTVLLGYSAMVVLGIVLGLIGAGGSILVVPILVYLLGIAPSEATGYSLVIVGTTALVGSVEYIRRGLTDLRMAALFGTPAIVAVYLTRRVLFPAIPDPVFQLGSSPVSKDAAVMVLFAILMLLMSVSMIRTKKGAAESGAVPTARPNLLVVILLGLGVGTFTGLVGAGGGFMILPVLVLMGGLPMRVAIGTDLLIIAAKSLIGFLGEMQVSDSIDYRFLGTIIALPLVGIVIGSQLNRRVSADRLKTAFGWFVLIMGIYVVLREVL